MHQNAEQMMDLEDPVNRTPKVVERTVPVDLALYGLVLLGSTATGIGRCRFRIIRGIVSESSVVSGEGETVPRGHPGGVAASESARWIRGRGLGGGGLGNSACAAYRVRQPRRLIVIRRRSTWPACEPRGP